MKLLKTLEPAGTSEEVVKNSKTSSNYVDCKVKKTYLEMTAWLFKKFTFISEKLTAE